MGPVWRHRLERRDHLRCVPFLHVCQSMEMDSELSSSPVSGTTCVKLNDYYSQCQPGVASTVPSGPTSTSTASGGTPTSSGGLSAFPASQLTQFSNFGTNPNNVQMFVYRPAKVAANPPLIVASHCASFCVATRMRGLTSSFIYRLHWYRAGILPGLEVRPAR